MTKATAPAAAPYVLTIADKRYSSWSMRAWLAVAASGHPYSERLVRLGIVDFADAIGSPSGKVPVLRDGEVVVHEALAIAEYVAEQSPSLWPADRARRALARAVSQEMASGFTALRAEHPMDLCRRAPAPLSVGARRDLDRIEALWAQCRAHADILGGKFLFGPFCLADAMFAPVATRIRSYALPVGTASQAYVDALFEHPLVAAWVAAAELEAAWAPLPTRAILPPLDGVAFAEEWAAAWNRRDLEAVLALFSDEVVFVSPKAAALTGSPEVVGKDALRAYWTAALDRRPTLHFAVDAAHLDRLGVLTIEYLSDTIDGANVRACEILTFNSDGKARRGVAYYGASK